MPNRILPAYGLLVLMVFALTACGTSDAQLTAIAQHDAASTQIAVLRLEATVAHARMRTTQDFALTRVKEVEQDGKSLRSTLVALGTEIDFIETWSSDMADLTPQPTAPIAANHAAAPQARLSVTMAQTAASVRDDAVAGGNQPRLEDIVLASGKDETDCATDRNPRFTPASAEIYVVARAYHIPTGATLSASWQQRGRNVFFYSFQAENPINDSCIWFSIDQGDAAFVTGTWSVELRLDDSLLAPPLPFQIAEN